MINTAILSFGSGGFQIQCVLDSIFFRELEGINLSAVIVSQKSSRAQDRAEHAGAPTFVVDRELFPNEASFALAILNKLADLDVELVIVPGSGEKLAPSLACAYYGRIIATRHSLYPAFSNVGEDESIRKSIEMGLRLSGSTVFMPDKEGNVGNILYQKAVPVSDGDDEDSLLRRILDEAESEILLRAIRDFCADGKSEEPGDGKIGEEAAEEGPSEESASEAESAPDIEIEAEYSESTEES